MNQSAKGKGGWLPFAAAGVLVLVLVVAAVALLRGGGEDEGEVQAQAEQTLTEACDAADFYIRTDQLPEARLILDRLLERYPDEARPHMLQAKLLMAEGDFEGAYEHADRSVEIDGEDAEAQFLTALLAEANREFEKGREHYAAASVVDPENAKYPMYLAQSLMRLNELDEARIQLLRAQRLDATLHQTYGMHAEIAARRGKLEMAIEQVNKALEHVEESSSHHVAYTLQKAELLRRANRPEAAQTLLQELPPGNQQEQRVVEQLAAGYMMMNQPERAAGAWAELFALEPTNTRAAAEAGMALLRAGKPQQARQYHEMARQLSTSHHMVVALEEALQSAE